MRHPSIALALRCALASLLASAGGSDLWADSTAPDQGDLVTTERAILAEINWLRTRPTEYARRVLLPLRETAQRLPPEAEQPYEAIKVYLNDQHRTDYIRIPEGENIAQALMSIDEAIETLRQTQPLPPLQPNRVLVQASRFFSRDFLDGGKQRPPHIDSLGRKPRARLASFGATPAALDKWSRFAAGLGDEREVLIRVFKQDNNFFWLKLSPGGGYRYSYVAAPFGEFIAKHGVPVSHPAINRRGHQCRVTIDVKERAITKGDASISYPLAMPSYGECVVWGPWSPAWAARGLVCWWVIDPGIPGRGHRKTLLQPDLRHAGVGCSWSKEIGWVATFDATSEPLVDLRK